MAQLTDGSVDILSRDDGRILSQVAAGNSNNTILLNQPSVVRIHGTRAMVTEFERQGNDLIVHMRDGSVKRYQQFFFDDVDGDHSELVFDDGVNPPEHALFPVTSEFADAQTAMVITPQYESLGTLEPLLLADTGATTGVVTAAGIGALGLGAAGIAALANNGGGGGGGGGADTPVATPAITVNPFTGDDFISVAEKNSAQTLNGTTTGTEAGNTVTIVLNGVTYTTTVGTDGSWSLTLPAAALAALPDGSNTLTVSVTNNAGATSSATDTFTVEAGTVTPTTPSITVAAFAGDDVLDNSEQQTSQTISGTTTNVPQGQTVTVTLNGQTYTATVDANGAWSVAVPATALQALAAGTATITATVTDAAGTAATTTHDFTVNAATTVPAIAIDTFADDDVLDGAEQQLAQTVSGTTTNVPQGQTVTVTLNGQTYTATVDANGAWSVAVPATALQALAAGTATITATVTDAAGTAANATHDFTIEPATVSSISVGELSGDGYLSGAEAQSDLTVSGFSTGLPAGTVIRVSLGGRSYTANVGADGSWSTTVPAADLQQLSQGSNLLIASATLADGTVVQNSSAAALNVLTAEPNASIDVPFGDTVLSGSEAGTDQTLTGNTGVAGAGQTVTATVGGTDYTGTVNNDGSWSVSIPSATLQNLPQGSNDITVVVTDPAGNSATSTTPVNVVTAPPSLTVTPTDTTLNQSDVSQPLTLSGVSPDSQSVAVTLNGVTYNTTVNPDGSWSVNIPASDLQQLPSGDNPITVVATDSYGNSNSQEIPLSVDTTPPLVTVNTLSGDGYVNASEVTQPLIITGTTEPGSTVLVRFDSVDLTATVDPETGIWTATLSPEDQAGIPDGTWVVNVTATDGAGNIGQTYSKVTFATTTPAITLNELTADGTLDGAEAAVDQRLTGTVTNVAAGQIITLTLADGSTYTGAVESGGGWGITLPAATLSALANGTQNYSVSVSDAAGNTGNATGSFDVAIDNSVPTLAISPISGDNALNATEAQADLVIGGSSAGLAASTPLTVTFNGVDYATAVNPDGSWSVTVPAAALSGIANGSYTVTVAGVDANSNPVTVDSDLAVRTSFPADIIVNSPFGDGILNAAESTVAQTLTGNSGVNFADQAVTVTVDGVDYAATVDTFSGAWSVALLPPALESLQDGTANIVVTVSDSLGNTVSSTTPFTVDTAAPALDVAVPGDNGTINSQTQNQPLAVSGTAEAGSTISVALDGVTYLTAADADGNWSVNVSPSTLQTLADGKYDITVTATDAGGNQTTSRTPITIDTAAPALTVSPISGDGYLNAAEHAADLSVAGTADAGSAVVVTLNGATYNAVADESGNWNVSVPAADVGALPDGAYSVNVQATDSAGNTTATTQPLQVVAAAASQPTITVAPFTGDGVLDGAEKDLNQLVTGTTTNVQAGQTVTVTLNGGQYTGTVQADGSWSVLVPAAAYYELPDGPQTLTVNVADAAGNTATASSGYTIDDTFSAIAIGVISDDNAISAAEAQNPLVIHGSTRFVAFGARILVRFNNADYETTANSDGSWSVTVPASALSGLPNGNQTVTATATDENGNLITTTQSLDSAVNPDFSVTLNEPFTDGVLNGAEAAVDQLISGSTGVSGSGQSVSLVLNGITYTGTVDADGNWSVQLPSAVLQSLPQNENTLTVTVTDPAGNTSSLTNTFDVNTSTPILTLDPVADDNRLNLAEQGQPLTITGTGEEGDVITLVLNNATYTATVDGTGSWSVDLPAAALQALTDGSYPISVSTVDTASNVSSLVRTLDVDLTPPPVTVNVVATDGYLNAAEASQPLVISGTGETGNTINVALNDANYSVIVGADGQWTLTVPNTAVNALADGNYTLSVTATDPAGNTAVASTPLVVDTSAPTIVINDLTDNNIIDGAEQQTDQLLTGTVANAEAGQQLTITLNGVEYTTALQNGGTWQITLPAADLVGLANGTQTISATITDLAGNAATASKTFTVDNTLSSVAFDPLSADGYLNAVEAQTDLTVTGSTANVAEGSTVTFTLGGQTYTGTVAANGSWTVTVPSADLQALEEGPQTATASVVAENGATVTSENTLNVYVDRVPEPTLQTPFTDGTLTNDEASATQTLAGTTGQQGDGQTVTVNIGGTDYAATVNSSGNWTLDLSPEVLQALPQGDSEIAVTVTDVAGNVASITPAPVITVATTLPTLTLDPVAGDNVINADEQGAPLTVSGTGTVGDDITVTLNGTEYTTTVPEGGAWSLNIPAADLAALADGPYVLQVSASDIFGNTSTQNQGLSVDTAAPTFTVDPVTGDNIIDGVEQGQAQDITGTGSEGDTITVTLGGETFTTTVPAGGQWSVSVPASTLANLTEGDNTLTVAVTSPAGNATSQDTTIVLDSAVDVDLVINAVTGDDLINAAEAAQGFNVTGSVPDDTTAVVVTFNGTDYPATVGANGLWSAAIPATALAGVADGDYQITVTASPASGGSLSLPRTITLDATPPALTVAAISDDNFLNAAEQAQPLDITGTGEAGDSVRVTLNGVVYTATVGDDLNWTVTVPATDTIALTGSSYPVTVTATDPAGNATTQTSTLAVDLTAPALTVNPLSGDGVLNAEEQAQPLTVSGTAENGATITVTLEGTDYTATAAANGQWTLDIPAAALAGLTNGDYTLTVSAADAAGNVTSQNSTLTVVADADTLPTLTLDNFAGNNILDGAEQQVSQEISGTTTNVQAGQVVTVTLNGITYDGVVQDSGAWSVTIPSAVLAQLPAGTQTYTVSVGDTAGNPATASGSFDVNTDISAVAINPLSDDGYLNATEAQSDLTVSGAVSNIPEGNTVTVTINGVDYTTAVAGGAWSLTVPAADLAALPEGPVTVSASVPDADGNAVTSDTTLNVAITTLPVLTIDTPFTEGTLNADEAAAAQTLTGTTGITGDGQSVSIAINGNNYIGTVDGDGNWSIILPPEVLQALPQDDTITTVTISDAAGNTAASVLTLNVDTLPPAVAVGDIAGDNIVNATEQASDLPISGTGEANATIVVTLNGNDYTTTVGTDNQWTVTVPAADLANLADGSYVVTTTATDTAGNSASTESPLTVKASAAAQPTISVDPFAGNDTLNGAEQQATQYLSGTTTNVEAGQQLTATLNGVAYTTRVLASGAWRVAIPSSALAALNDGTATFSVAVSDAAGNPVTVTREFTVDSTAAGISIDPLSTDGYLNATEAQDSLIVTGTTTGVAQGATVTVDFNGQTFTGLVGAGGAWNAVIPASALAGLADGAATLTATVTDASGATATGTGTLNVQVNDLPAAAADAPFNDGVLNGTEAATDQTLTGSTGVTGDGQTVAVVVGTTTYTGNVDANGNWSVTIPTAELQALPQGANTLQVTVADAAGNTSALAVPVTVDTAAPTLTLDAVAGDGVVNASEAAADIIVSGGSTGAEEGQIVTVSVNGQSYTTAIAADGSWSLALPAGLLQASPDGTYPLTVSLSDAAGNTATQATDITLATTALQPTLDTLFDDNYLSITEAQSDQTLSGTTGATGAGQAVTVNIAGTDYTATVDNDGNWTLPVNAATLQALGEGIQTVTVTATDAVGNTGTAATSINVDYTAPALTIDPVAGDNTINAAESVGPIAITGTASASEAGQLVTVTFNGVNYQQTVQDDGSWTVNLPSEVTQGIADGTYAVSASLTDAAGNVTTQAQTVTVSASQASLPTLTLDPISGDNYVNQSEAGADLAITGTTTNVGEGQTVTVTLNGTAYTAQVQEDGSWAATIPAADIGALDDGAQTLVATVVNGVGNTGGASGEFILVAQPASLPAITVDPLTGDDVVNSQETQSDVIVTGTSQSIPEGGAVTVTLNGVTYTGAVDADGNWSVTLPAADAQALAQGTNTITASASDVAGNVATATNDFTVDTVAPVLQVTLSSGTDNILNAAEAAAGLIVSGTTEAGLPVSVTLNNKVYAATAADDGTWSLTIASGDLAALSDGSNLLTVVAADASGNASTNITDLNVAINALPTLTLDTPFTDGLVNATEAATDLTVSGAATNLAAGTPVTVTIGDQTFTGAVNADGATWSATVPAGTFNTLGDGIYQLTIASADVAGNPATAGASVEVLATTLPTAAINTPFVDGLLNAAEAGIDQTISGTTGTTGAGQTVTLDIDGTPLTATVDDNGNWTATLTPALAATLGNGDHAINVSVADAAGNVSTDSLTYTAIVTGLPVPTLTQPFADGVLNAAEAAAGQTLTGSTGITGAQTVSVDINGTAYQATVDPATGDWTLPLGADVLTALPDGTLPVTVTVTDAVGNVGTATDSALVAVNALPAVTIDLPFTDGLLNVAEAATAQTLSGNTGLVAAGQTVNVTIDGGTPLAATVNENGNWTLDLTSDQLTALGSGTHTFAVTATDSAGNASTSTLDFDALLELPQPTISAPLFSDDILNIAEAGAAIALTGTTGVTGANQGVQLQIDVAGITYTGTVDANGNWLVSLPAGALSSLEDGAHSIDVTVIDAAGNTNTNTLGFTAALTAPTPTLDVPFDNAYLNAADVAAGASLTGSTGLAGAGQTVAVTVGGSTYNAGVEADGSWTLALTPTQLSALGQGVQNYTVVATDVGGNSATAAGSFTVDTALPTVTINALTGDNALDYQESLTTQTLTGTATDASEGQTVTVTIGTATATGVIAADGSWSVNLTPELLAQLGTTGDTGTITASVTDLAGNTGTTTAAVAVDLTPPATPILTLDPISTDNIVNSTDGATLTVSGTFANLPATGGVVTGTVAVTINGVAQTATAAVDSENGTWTLTVPNTVANIAEGTATVTATLTTDQGTTLNATSEVLVDRIAPTVTINAFAGDDVLNSTEAAASQTISGTASTSEAGRAVTVTLNDRTYTAVVQADGSWSTSVASGDLQALGQDGQTITATLTDAAGNTGTATRDFDVDTAAPLIQVDALLGDNLLNAADILVTQVLTGTATGAEGETIGLYLGDSSPIATAIVGADGTFSLDLTPEVLGSLTDGTLVFGLRVNDAAGNATDATLTVNKVVNQALNLVVDSVFGDGFLNAADTAVAQTITGLATSAGIGATVSLELGGTTLTANVGQDGRFALVVPPSLLGLLSDGDTALNIVLTDAAGNTRTVGETVTAILEAPVINALTGLFGGDNLLNIAEAAVAQTVGGTINGTTGSTVTVSLGSKSYQTTLQAGGAWSVSIPAVDLAALTTGNQTLGVSVTDPAGNTSSTSTTIGIFTAQPSITLNPIFGDGILNIADALTNQTISGTVNNVAAGSTINLTLGSSTLQATVGQNGAFTATVTPDILGTLTSGNLTVGASVTDAAGNTASTTGNLVAKLTAPVINIAQLFGDGLLNVADAALGQTVTGTVTNAGAGSRVVVTVAGTQLVTATAADGSFSVALTPDILKGLANGNLTVGVSVTDSAGNTSSATAGAVVGLTLPTVTLDPVFGGDGVLNLVESLVTQTISGRATNVAQGSTVTISLGNTTVTAVVGADGVYSAQVSPAILSTLLDGNLTVGVSVTDTVGNTASTSAGVRVGIHTTPSLTVNTVFGDSVLSANDINVVQTISGTTRNVAAGSIVTVTLNGKTYTASVNSSGGWTLNVPKADLSVLANGILTVNASVTDSYGNTATNTGQLVVIAQTPPTVTVSSIFGDGLLNAVDAQSTQTISGSSTNAEGSILTVRVGTATLTTTINANGTWSVSVPSAVLAALPDGTATVNASVTNAVGNAGSGSDTATVRTHTLPTVAITNSTVFGGDHYLNLSEANVAETISGTSTNAVGSTVTVNIAGNTYTTTVGANGAWSVTVPSATLRAIPDGNYTITATVTDAVGNTSTGSDTFTAITHNLPAIGVDPVLSLVNVLLSGLTVTGGTLNLAQGTTLNVTLNGTTVTATTDALGRYSAKFTGTVLTALNLNSIVTVTAVDAAGNRATTSNTLLLGSLLPASTTSTAAAATALLAVAADDSTAIASTDTSNTDTATTAVTARVATVSTDSSETHSATTSTTTESAATDTSATTTSETAAGTAAVLDDNAVTTVNDASAAATDDSGYSIGGLVIALADGQTVEGASVEGSSGNDTVTLSNLNFSHIDGGAGTDTLVLNGENMTLDLTALGLKVEHIEIINLGSSGTNSVKLDLNEALNITDKQTDDLIIKGVTGDQVTLTNGDGGTWATTAQKTLDGQVYDVYHNSALDTANTLGDVLIQHNLQVHLV